MELVCAFTMHSQGSGAISHPATMWNKSKLFSSPIITCIMLECSPMQCIYRYVLCVCKLLIDMLKCKVVICVLSLLTGSESPSGLIRETTTLILIIV